MSSTPTMEYVGYSTFFFAFRSLALAAPHWWRALTPLKLLVQPVRYIVLWPLTYLLWRPLQIIFGMRLLLVIARVRKEDWRVPAFVFVTVKKVVKLTLDFWSCVEQVTSRGKLHVPVQWTFWQLYLLFARPEYVSHDYAAACQAELCRDGTSPHTLMFFCDYKEPVYVPCRPDMTDREFFELLRPFYYLQKIRRGALEALSVRTLGAIEVVELQDGRHAGSSKEILLLGRYDDSRMIRSFREPKSLVTDTILRSLVQYGGLIVKTDDQTARHTHALNFVSTWDANLIAAAILLPFVASVAVSVAWSAVAVIRYRLDVQASVQTGFTVGAFIATAGALLIALVAFIAAVQDSNSNRFTVFEKKAAEAMERAQGETRAGAAEGAQEDNRAEGAQEETRVEAAEAANGPGGGNGPKGDDIV